MLASPDRLLKGMAFKAQSIGPARPFVACRNLSDWSKVLGRYMPAVADDDL